MKNNDQAVKRSERARLYREQAVAQKGELVLGLPMVRWYDGAWSFLLSFQPDSRLWIFSAQLHPPGRGSVESDWQLLGAWAAAVRAPAESLVGDTIRTSPNAVHKWTWVAAEDAVQDVP
jgi:hypothetical protein